MRDLPQRRRPDEPLAQSPDDEVASTLTIEAVAPSDPEVRALLAELDDYLLALYPNDPNTLMALEPLSPIDTCMYLARVSGSAAGCAALNVTSPGYAELKRFYVSPLQRRCGIGARLLDTIEQAASQQGFGCLRLETGTRQAQAQALFRHRGFHECGRFGHYQANRYSIYMEKLLTGEKLLTDSGS